MRLSGLKLILSLTPFMRGCLRAMTRKRHDCDVSRTEEAWFHDKRSYITHAGLKFLFGADVRQLRQDVYVRDEGKCQKCGELTLWNYGHLHHVKHRGQGGADNMENVIWICRDCHASEHLKVRFGNADV